MVWKAAKVAVLSMALISAGTFSLGMPRNALADEAANPPVSDPSQTTTQAPSVYSWQQIDNEWYYIDQYGNKKIGWTDDQGKRYYTNAQGVRQSGWIFDNLWYYLSPTDGSMVTNQWVLYNNVKYYLGTSGAMLENNWTQWQGNWYYLGKGGGMLVNSWVQWQGVWYYLSMDGSRLENQWLKWNGAWYYLGSNGVMKSNAWITYKNAQYYLSGSGKMLTGWQEIGGKWYYFYSEGAMAVDTIIGGYIVGKDGVWIPLKSSILLNAPLISQLPQLPKGCEVTSLAMMLNYAGYKVDKMTLAKQIKTVPYRDAQGYYGNPNDGFVGNMYTALSKPDGYGPNHGPVFDLAKKYLGTKAVDLTGQSFTRVLQKLNEGKPVWVIHTFGYAPVPQSKFFSVKTRKGIVKINSLEHSVLITGYDSHYIYFNDPYAGIKNRKADRTKFIAAWVQLGSQAVSYN